MQKPLRLLLALVLIGAGIWAWRIFFPTPERAIRSRLAKLAANASFEPGDNALARAFRIQHIPDFFTPDVVISLEIGGFEARTISGREELRSVLAVLASPRMTGLKVVFVDINVTLGPDKQTAIANLTGQATLESQRELYVHEFNFMLKKVDGDWLIYRVETVKTLSRGWHHSRSAALPSRSSIETPRCCG